MKGFDRAIGVMFFPNAARFGVCPYSYKYNFVFYVWIDIRYPTISKRTLKYCLNSGKQLENLVEPTYYRIIFLL